MGCNTAWKRTVPKRMAVATDDWADPLRLKYSQLPLRTPTVCEALVGGIMPLFRTVLLSRTLLLPHTL